MLECPHCYRVFRSNPEKLGARCPKCRMPLFERGPKRNAPEKDLGPCARHPENRSVAKCVHCARLMCAACRTRWSDEAHCPECIEQALASGAPTPQETQRQLRLAWTGLVLAVVGWFAALAVFWPLASLHAAGTTWQGFYLFLGTVIFAFSFAPALMALGHSVAALRLRGPMKTLATCGLVTAGVQLGVLIGVVVLNLWHN
jgi:hypothetical protein